MELPPSLRRIRSGLPQRETSPHTDDPGSSTAPASSSDHLLAQHRSRDSMLEAARLEAARLRSWTAEYSNGETSIISMQRMLERYDTDPKQRQDPDWITRQYRSFTRTPEGFAGHSHEIPASRRSGRITERIRNDAVAIINHLRALPPETVDPKVLAEVQWLVHRATYIQEHTLRKPGDDRTSEEREFRRREYGSVAEQLQLWRDHLIPADGTVGRPGSGPIEVSDRSRPPQVSHSRRPDFTAPELKRAMEQEVLHRNTREATELRRKLLRRVEQGEKLEPQDVTRIGMFPPGPRNDITDVMDGQGRRVQVLMLTENTTGVTIIKLPPGPTGNPWEDACLFKGGWINPNGQMTSLDAVNTFGVRGPIAITDSHSVPRVYEAAVRDSQLRHPQNQDYWALPVIGEVAPPLHDLHSASPIQVDQVLALMQQGYDAGCPPVRNGNEGAGKGSGFHGYKGGTGTASRQITFRDLSGREKTYMFGALVTTNHGVRDHFSINGVQMSDAIARHEAGERGSIITGIVTNMPLGPDELKSLYQIANKALSHDGAAATPYSGDGAFITTIANRDSLSPPTFARDRGPAFRDTKSITQNYKHHLHYLVEELVHEAILKAAFAAERMEGNGNTLDPIPMGVVVDQLYRAGRLEDARKYYADPANREKSVVHVNGNLPDD